MIHTVQDLSIYKPTPTSKCAKNQPICLNKERGKKLNGFRPVHTYIRINVSSQSIPFKKLQNMRIRLEKPKKENSLVVLLSVQVSPAQLGKMQLKKQINKQTKKPHPNQDFFFLKNVFTTLISLKVGTQHLLLMLDCHKQLQMVWRDGENKKRGCSQQLLLAQSFILIHHHHLLIALQLMGVPDDSKPFTNLRQ